MRKGVVGAAPREAEADETWLDLERLADVEVTSEDPAYPIEAALLPGRESGWRAAAPGEQTIRLTFAQPQRLQRIRLRFVERTAERTQEFTLRWSQNGARMFREVIRQQYAFSPDGATNELEDIRVDLTGVTTLELAIWPDQGRGRAHASLAEWRLAS